MGETAETAETAETGETAEPCETVDLAPAAVLVRHGRICTALGHYRANFVQQNPLGFDSAVGTVDDRNQIWNQKSDRENLKPPLRNGADRKILEPPLRNRAFGRAAAVETLRNGAYPQKSCFLNARY